MFTTVTLLADVPRLPRLTLPRRPGPLSRGRPWLTVLWAMSRRCRNKLQHALHGNGGPSGRNPRQKVSTAGAGTKGPASRLTPRQSQEPQKASALRAAGWELPSAVGPEELIRVYDTRVEQSWLHQLVLEAFPGAPAHLELIGGDFVSKPLRTDAEALDPTRLRRWGPEGAGLHHLVVPPRQHQASWIARAVQQLPLEDDGSTITVCCVVDRALCPDAWSQEALSRALPCTASLLKEACLEVRVAAVGERPPLQRVPASERRLPPNTWEAARLAQSRVLVLVSMRRGAAKAPAWTTSWVRGQPPASEPSAMELLRVEYLLPPATRSQQAERSLRSALRKVAEAVGCTPPAAPQLSQVQVEHGGVVCIFAVSRAEARAWLRGSGCQGVFLRPFWTKDTGSQIQRDQFALHWLRGHGKDAEKIWAALKDEPGFFGLLAGGPDVAVRLSAEAVVQRALQQVRFTLQRTEVAFRQATPGARWWKLGPLTPAEVIHVKSLIPQFGLSWEGDQVRFGAAGRFRSFAFFRASGQPSRHSLDEGGWNSSVAELRLAEPPPRQGSKAP